MATTWRVTRDTPDQYDPTGSANPELGHIVEFITGQGSRGSVFIPEDHYNPAAVRTLINGKAKTADAISAMTGEA